VLVRSAADARVYARQGVKPPEAQQEAKAKLIRGIGLARLEWSSAFMPPHLAWVDALVTVRVRLTQ